MSEFSSFALCSLFLLLDPNAYADGRLKLLSQQRVERATLDSEMDTENLNQLSEIRKTIALQTETDLRAIGSNLRSSMTGDGKYFWLYLYILAPWSQVETVLLISVPICTKK